MPDRDSSLAPFPLKKLFVDITSACLSGCSVAPFVAVIDQAVVQNAAGTVTLAQSIRQSAVSILKNPIPFFKSPQYRWMFLLYAGTYASVNTTDTLCEWMSRSSVLPVLAASTVANSGLSIAKDAAFAKLFGAIKPAPVPMGSYGLWFTRDILSMAFIFTLPPIVTPIITQKSEGWLSPAASGVLAQLTSPVVLQLPATALHLGGLDYYNRRNVSLGDRATLLREKYGKILVARSLRVFFPFSIGAMMNKKLRSMRDSEVIDEKMNLGLGRFR